jgi:hypothetical protein
LNKPFSHEDFNSSYMTQIGSLPSHFNNFSTQAQQRRISYKHS